MLVKNYKTTKMLKSKATVFPLFTYIFRLRCMQDEDHHEGTAALQ